MRGIIRDRLAAGDTPDQVRAYFVDRYGLWILLAPPRQGFNLLVWIVPFVGLAAGIAVVSVIVRRWSRRPRSGGTEVPAVDEAMRARIAREMAEMDR
jgi:cytochrome c-type biogenesis protein CcmH